MADKSIIIIGAGMAGLSTGCYARMNGYKTQIFELDTRPGGLCTSWKRKGYTFDCCLHYLMGSRSGPVHRFLGELGAVQGRPMVDNEVFLRVEGAGGKAWTVYADLDRLEQHTKELAPGDADVIEEYCNAVRLFGGTEMPMDTPGELMGPPDPAAMAKLMPALQAMGKYGQVTLHDYAARFKDPFLREVFPYIMEDMPGFPMSILMMTMGEIHKQNAGWPVGGSLEFAKAIEQRYLGLGGEVQYKSRVEKVLVENDRAVGVRLADGTIFDMLDGKYVDDKIRHYYDEWPIFRPAIQVSLGVARDFSGEPHSVVLPLDEPFRAGDMICNRLHAYHYGFDPSMAPAGKSVVTAILYHNNYEYWKKLYEDREKYKAEKRAIADAVIDRLEKRFPGTKEHVEVVDVATPMTYERYTNNWQGSYEGWGITAEAMAETMSRSLPGLDRFYMAGQWIFNGGGIPGAVMSGRNLMQIICKQDKKKFQTSTP